jgi:DNA polymerase
MGERELVLDSLSVEEAMAVVAGRSVGAESTKQESAVRSERPTRETASADAASGDWRAALRAAGAAPGSPLPALEVPTPSGDIFAGGATQLATLEDIAREVATCQKCPLYKTATNPVPGEGHANAQLMCVGEAPGATEDETGRPFVGAAGQLLTKILAAIDLPREQVYICNVLKHRPPGNRNPAPEEVTACSPYLIRQIELIKPKVILALGTFAAQTLLNTKTPIGKLRGSVHRYHGVPLVVTYHPAALLRNPGWKRPTWEDVQLARRILDSSSPGA